MANLSDLVNLSLGTGCLLPVKGGQPFWCLLVGGHFQIRECTWGIILINFMKVLQSSKE